MLIVEPERIVRKQKDLKLPLFRQLYSIR